MDIKTNTKNIENREVKIFTDNKYILREYHKLINKASDVTGKARGIIEAMR